MFFRQVYSISTNVQNFTKTPLPILTFITSDSISPNRDTTTVRCETRPMNAIKQRKYTKTNNGELETKNGNKISLNRDNSNLQKTAYYE
jgi:hypothetical protein